jgi:hypothetical protein
MYLPSASVGRWGAGGTGVPVTGTYMCVCVCVYVCVYMCVCMCVCVYVCVLQVPIHLNILCISVYILYICI